jgi:hypothetical protein
VGQPERSSEQLATERAMAEVSAVMLNIEHSLERARVAHKRVAGMGDSRNIELALKDTIQALEKLRKQFRKDAYNPTDTLRLM